MDPRIEVRVNSTHPADLPVEAAVHRVDFKSTINNQIAVTCPPKTVPV